MHIRVLPPHALHHNIPGPFCSFRHLFKKKKKPCKHRLDCVIKTQSWDDHQRSERPFGGLVYLPLPPPPTVLWVLQGFYCPAAAPPRWCPWNEKVQHPGMKILNQVAQRGGQCRGDFCDNEAPRRIIKPLWFFFYVSH